MGQIIYQIDDEDRISHVNEGWTRSANDSGAGDACSDHQVVGQSLWASISDPTTIDLYRHIVALVRSGRMVQFHYRCDVPAFRRIFEMRVEQSENDNVRFTSTLASEQARPSVALLDSNVMPRVGSIRMCSWCQRIAGPADTWMAVEEAIESSRLLESGSLPVITHGICDECAARMYALIEAGGI
ncbi:MAG: hypothetical protein ABIV50_02670 [Opitutus sp.]